MSCRVPLFMWSLRALPQGEGLDMWRFRSLLSTVEPRSTLLQRGLYGALIKGLLGFTEGVLTLAQLMMGMAYSRSQKGRM